MRFISMIRGLMIGLIVVGGTFAGLTGTDAFDGDRLAGTVNTTFTTDDTPWD